ncbi:MAG TPA: hypothetical protein GX692_09670 [Acholeplasmataceae bacterium]|jgi:hypothetical protein|nr:hypothetical protein [Acholeplasmataceae bacterium]
MMEKPKKTIKEQIIENNEKIKKEISVDTERQIKISLNQLTKYVADLREEVIKLSEKIKYYSRILSKAKDKYMSK